MPGSGLLGFVGPDGFIGFVLMLPIPEPLDPGLVAASGGVVGEVLNPEPDPELPAEGAPVVPGDVVEPLGLAPPSEPIPIPEPALPPAPPPAAPCA